MKPTPKGSLPNLLNYSIQNYLESITSSRSANTARTYRYALNTFQQVLDDHDLPPSKTPVSALTEDSIAWFAAALKSYSPATERLYLTAVAGFFEYLAAERLADPNLPRVRLLIRQRARRTGQRLPQFPREAIEKVLGSAMPLPSAIIKDYASSKGLEFSTLKTALQAEVDKARP